MTVLCVWLPQLYLNLKPVPILTNQIRPRLSSQTHSTTNSGQTWDIHWSFYLNFIWEHPVLFQSYQLIQDFTAHCHNSLDHVTSSITWPFDSQYVVSYRCSVDTSFLSSTVTEIFWSTCPIVSQACTFPLKLTWHKFWVVEGSIRGFYHFSTFRG